LPSELSEAIKRIAQQEHVGISELVEYSTLAILTFYHGDLDFPSKTGSEQHDFALKIVKFDGFGVFLA